MMQMVGWSLRVIAERHGIFPPIPITAVNLDYFGGSWDTRVQLGAILDEMPRIVEEVQEFRSEQVQNELLEVVRSYLFTPRFEYRYFSDSNHFKTYDIDLVGAIGDIIVHSSRTIDLLFNPSFDGPEFLNGFGNSYNLSLVMTEVLSLMTKYIIETSQQNQFTTNVWLISATCIWIPLHFLSLFFQIRWIKENKMTVFRALTALPKSTVSAMAEGLRSGENAQSEGESSGRQEMNKQEDNILKIFVSVSSSSSINLTDGTWLIIATMCQVICTAVFIVLIFSITSNQHEAVVSRVNSIDSAESIYAFLLGTFTIFDAYMLESTGNPLPGIHAELYSNYKVWRGLLRKSYHRMLYTGPHSATFPVDIVNEFRPLNDRLLRRNGFNSTIFNPLSCWSVGQMFYLIDSGLTWRLALRHNGYTEAIYINDRVWTNCWVWMIYPIYDQYIAPLIIHVGDNIHTNLRTLNSIEMTFIILLGI
jgi:hypothetical protein